VNTLADKIKGVGLNRVAVSVAEWADALGGEQLYVRELTGAERGDLEATITDGVDIGKLRLKLVVQTLVTENGDKVFGTPKDVAGLAGSVVGRISDLALEVSGFTDTALDDAVKN
jgi:hypothetical protein